MRNGWFGVSIPPRRPAGRSTGAIAVVLALGMTGCATGAPAPGSASASAPASASGSTPAPAATVAVTPVATASPSSMASGDAAGHPPAANLAGLAGGGTVTGDLGSFTWDGLASDGPWIVERSGARAATLARLAVTYAGDTLPDSWTASWALIRGGSAGTPIAAGEGHGPVVIHAPGAAGSWSLRLTASFGEGRSGTWFWRLAVGP